MKNIFILLLAIALFLCAFACTKKNIIEYNDENKAPVMVWITKGDASSPMNIQVSNTTKEVIEYLKMELELKDTLSGKKCKVSVEVLSEKFSSKGLDVRTFLNPNATNIYAIDFDELEVAPCWGDIFNNWEHVKIFGKIAEIKFIPVGE